MIKMKSKVNIGDLAQACFQDTLSKAYKGISELDEKGMAIVLRRCSEDVPSTGWLCLRRNMAGIQKLQI